MSSQIVLVLEGFGGVGEVPYIPVLEMLAEIEVGVDAVLELEVDAELDQEFDVEVEEGA